MRVLALAGYDSFLNVANLIAPYFRDAGCDVEFGLVQARSSKQISQEQIDAIHLSGSILTINIEHFCKSGNVSKYDILLCCLEGLSTRRLVNYLSLLGNNRPLVISAYPGLVLRYKFDGFASRSASDLVWLNCEADLHSFREMCRAFNIHDGAARVLGTASLLKKIERPLTSATGPVVFFEQAIIPKSLEERKFLAEQLIALSRRYPDRRFIIKPRTLGTATTLHRAQHPFIPLIDQAVGPLGFPPNLSIETRSASDLLSEASHCLTINSTVAIEAIAAGIPTTIIGDFGAHEDYGLSYFFGSGLIKSLSMIDLDIALKPNEEWLYAYVTDPVTNIQSLVDEAILLARKPRRAYDNRSLSAEMSAELRLHLIKVYGQESVIGRSFQHKSKFSKLFGTIQHMNNSFLSLFTR